MTCLAPFIRPSTPLLSSVDIAALQEREKEVSGKKPGKGKSWGASDGGQHNPELRADLKRLDEVKKIKESLIQKPCEYSFFLQLVKREEDKRLQHKNAFNVSVSPVRGSGRSPFTSPPGGNLIGAQANKNRGSSIDAVPPQVK